MRKARTADAGGRQDRVSRDLTRLLIRHFPHHHVTKHVNIMRGQSGTPGTTPRRKPTTLVLHLASPRCGRGNCSPFLGVLLVDSGPNARDRLPATELWRRPVGPVATRPRPRRGGPPDQG